MPEELSFDKPLGEDLAAWAAIVAITKTPGSTTAIEEAKIKPHIVELRINGIEVSFSAIVQRMMGVIDERALQKAKELIKERCSGVEDTLWALTDMVKTHSDELLAKFERELEVGHANS